MPKVDLNITDLSVGGCNSFQVRVVVDRTEYSRAFNWAQHGGKDKALRAARRYRNKLYKEHGTNKPKKVGATYRRKYNQHKYKADATTGVVGVNRTCLLDPRRPHLPPTVRYAVSWRDYWYYGTKSEPHPRIKTFHVGYVGEVTPAMEVAALNAARDFRREWEHAIDNNVKFQLSPHWQDWREIYGPKLKWPSQRKAY